MHIVSPSVIDVIVMDFPQSQANHSQIINSSKQNSVKIQRTVSSIDIN
jgi:hypothetical protein